MKNNGSFAISFVVASLIALVACSIYLAVTTQQEHQAQIERQAAYEEHVAQMQAWLTRQQRVITSATDNYHADAYDPGVERIAEQQLIAAEYQLLLLQTIAQQNAQMIELMMIAGP